MSLPEAGKEEDPRQWSSPSLLSIQNEKGIEDLRTKRTSGLHGLLDSFLNIFPTRYLSWVIMVEVFLQCLVFLCAFFNVLDIDWLTKCYFNLGSLMQMLIVELCSSSSQSLVKDWDLFALQINGPNLSCFCIFDHAFLWSTGVGWHQLACVTDVPVYSSSSS